MLTMKFSAKPCKPMVVNNLKRQLNAYVKILVMRLTNAICKQITALQKFRLAILSSSPAENSGLKAGDRIIGYAGERVFNVRDLNKLTVQGEAGESVLLEIERDGEPIQLTIPRGPIGINSDRRR